MLRIYESVGLKATQLLNEADHLVGQWHWDTFDREWAFEKAKEMKKEIELYREERGEFGYTNGVRRT